MIIFKKKPDYDVESLVKQIIVKFKFRSSFAFLFKEFLYLIIAAFRGCGKTYNVGQFMLYELFTNPVFSNNLAILASTDIAKCKAVLQKPFNEILNMWPKDLWDFNGNTSTYRFNFGLNDKRSIMLLTYNMSEATLKGHHVPLLVTDETGYMPRKLFDTVFMGYLDEKARYIGMGTVTGKDIFYELFTRAGIEYIDGKVVKNPELAVPGWQSYHIPASRLPEYMSPEEFHRKKLNMSHFAFEQEYECNFEASLTEGAILADIINNFTLKNISDDINWISSNPVYASIDIGHTNKTVIWYYQLYGNIAYFIDCDVLSNIDKHECIRVLLAKPYTYGKVIFGHDAAHHTFQDSESTEETFSKYFPVYVIRTGDANIGIRDGIEQMREMLKVSKFNKSLCADKLTDIKQISWKQDPVTNLYIMTEVQKNIHMDKFDSLRYAAVSIPIMVRQAQTFYNVSYIKDINIHMM